MESRKKICPGVEFDLYPARSRNVQEQLEVARSAEGRKDCVLKNADEAKVKGQPYAMRNLK